MEAPLHVAASTLLRNLHPDYTARFYFLLTGFSPRAADCLRRTLDRTERAYSMHLLEPTGCEVFAEYPKLHGSLTNYHRLLLPELVQEDRLLYLDSDIRVTVDVSSLFEEDMGAKATGFVISGKVECALDHQFQRALGRPQHAPIFNDGVCLFNVREWRRQELGKRILAFGSRYKAELSDRDQSLLNAIFADDCHRLDRKYNVALTPAMNHSDMPSSGILHYVGSPKPWDIGARFLLPYAKPWYNDLRDTAVPFWLRLNSFNIRAWARLPRIIGGYRFLPCLRKMYSPRQSGNTSSDPHESQSSTSYDCASNERPQ